MERNLQEAVVRHIQELIYLDSLEDEPIVQSVSLFFWENLVQWTRQIAMVPEPFTIALTGASGSGKSYIREVIVDELSRVSSVSSFTQDNYYRDFEADFPHLPLDSFYDEIDLDDPAHIRFKHLKRDLERIKGMAYGTRVGIPKLRFGTPTSKPTIIEQGLTIEVNPFIVTEGIHCFHDPGILPLYDFKIYVDIEEKNRRQRWLERNQRENRGTTENMWRTTVECLNRYILPTREVADLVINNDAPQPKIQRFLQDVIRTMAAPLRAARKDIA